LEYFGGSLPFRIARRAEKKKAFQLLFNYLIQFAMESKLLVTSLLLPEKPCGLAGAGMGRVGGRAGDSVGKLLVTAFTESNIVYKLEIRSWICYQ
jgi:hypothetical protein